MVRLGKFILGLVTQRVAFFYHLLIYISGTRGFILRAWDVPGTSTRDRVYASGVAGGVAGGTTAALTSMTPKTTLEMLS